MPACAHCAAPAAPLVCTGCLAALYCAAACQRAAWPAHKAACAAANAVSPRDAQNVVVCAGCGVAVAEGEAFICGACRSVKYCGAACKAAHAAAHAPGCGAAATMLFTATYNQAEAGEVEAQAMAGYYLSIGIGVAADHVEAVKWYTRAAEAGDVCAQTNLGCKYRNGKGVAKDAATAVKLWTRAAGAGHTDAQYNLGCSYRNGEGVAKDAAKAVEWWTRAAEAGQTDAQYSLGGCFCDGKGVTKDAAKAVEWWTRAAKAGHMDALYNLGCCYRDGDGVAADAAKAVEWFTRAAEADDASSQLALATHLYNGTGTARDKAAAAEWYVRAIDTDADVPGSDCWAREFARHRAMTKAYAATLRSLAASTRRSTAGVAAFLAAAARGACACDKCASGMD